jgi:hypothetical protein
MHGEEAGGRFRLRSHNEVDMPCRHCAETERARLASGLTMSPRAQVVGVSTFLMKSLLKATGIEFGAAYANRQRTETSIPC